MAGTLIFARNNSLAFALGIVCCVGVQGFAAKGQLELYVVDAQTGAPTVARMRLQNAQGKTIVPQNTIRAGREFYVEGSIVLSLSPGTYRFSIDRGHEYRPQQGHFEISGGDQDHTTVELHRFVEMAHAGWWSGDLQCHQTTSQLASLMDGEDLHFAAGFSRRPTEGEVSHRKGAEGTQGSVPLIQRPFVDATAIDLRTEGSLLVTNVTEETAFPHRPIEWLTPSWDKNGRYRIAGHATAWELPLWIGSQHLDGFFVLGPTKNAQTDCYLPADFGDSIVQWQPPLDDRDLGRWSEHVYYQMLECGLRIPALAATASGWSSDPLGASRTYARIRSEPTVDAWWKAVMRGRTMITNGPLILVEVNRRPPGYLFSADAGEEVELDVALTLHTKQMVEYLEIIKNGRVEHSVRLDAWAAANGKLPLVRFAESGWMLVRAVTTERDYHQYAMTGPYFVKIDDRPRISRSAVEFFTKWLQAAYERNKDTEMSRYYRAADRFWRGRWAAATTD